jgi:hypothetical protein
LKTYLSIDIDFWNDWLIPDKVYDYLSRLCHQLWKSRVPMVAVMNHQQLLNPVNESQARRLINIDKHSDLADSRVDRLNCGTWISYVKWRRDNGRYLWLHKHSAWEGECNQDPEIFREKVTVPSLSDWTKIAHRRIRYNPDPKWLMDRDIVNFGLVLSPSFSDRDLEPVFRAIVKEHKISYLKGMRRENKCREGIRPPGRG